MTILLNRRQILAGLLGVGASMAFASPVAQASKHLVDLEWQRLATDPWFFDIIDLDGTISEGTAVEPSVYSDLFQISDADLSTTAGLIGEVERYAPLTDAFRMAASSALEDVRDQLLPGAAVLKPKERKLLQALQSEMDDEENGWKAINILGMGRDAIRKADALALQLAKDGLHNPLRREVRTRLDVDMKRLTHACRVLRQCAT
jgi:hypothetical protein